MNKFDIVILILAPFLGFFSFLAPFFVSGFDKIYSDKLIVTIGLIYENANIFPTVVLLFMVGVFLGYFAHRIWWIVSITTIIIFPITSIIEMKISPMSHNLWPIEFALYPFIALPAIIGSYIGKIKKEAKKSGVKPWTGTSGVS